MLQFFRKMMNSRVGIIVALVFLALIALAFASADVSNSNSFGGVAGGDRVASVGKQRIDASALSTAATNALEGLKQENPRLTMQAFLAQGGLNQVLDQLIERTALGEFGQEHGIIASDRLVDSEITKLDAFKGPDGKFSQAAFRQALQQRGMSEKLVRADLGQGLIARQLLVPAAFGAKAPHELASRYVTLLRENRSGAIGLLPSAAFAPKTPPTDAELAAFYAREKNRFVRPERRVVRYAVFGEGAVKAPAAPTDAEIAAAYDAARAQYAAKEARRVTQLVVPTEPAAKAIAAEIAGGKSLEAAAAAKGLSAASLGTVTREGLAGSASQAVADATFAAAQGKLAAPARSALGWHLMRIDAIENRPARSLEQARGELVAQLTERKRRAAINDMSARIEEEFDQGGNLAETAKELGVTLQSTPAITADGRVYAQPDAKLPPELARVVPAAFAMERENEPQLAEVEAGKTFIIYDVTAIQPSAPAPLKDIAPDVATALMLEKGATAAKAAALRVLAQVRKGGDLGAAMAGLGVALPPVDRVAMNREQLSQRGAQVPPPLALLFSMAEGTVKVLPAPGNRGYFVVALKDIEPGKVAQADPLLAAAQRELGLSAGREYAEALRRAITAELGVERNANAIGAVRKRLVGGN